VCSRGKDDAGKAGCGFEPPCEARGRLTPSRGAEWRRPPVGAWEVARGAASLSHWAIGQSLTCRRDGAARGGRSVPQHGATWLWCGRAWVVRQPQDLRGHAAVGHRAVAYPGHCDGAVRAHMCPCLRSSEAGGLSRRSRGRAEGRVGLHEGASGGTHEADATSSSHAASSLLLPLTSSS